MIGKGSVFPLNLSSADKPKLSTVVTLSKMSVPVLFRVLCRLDRLFYDLGPASALSALSGHAFTFDCCCSQLICRHVLDRHLSEGRSLFLVFPPSNLVGTFSVCFPRTLHDHCHRQSVCRSPRETGVLPDCLGSCVRSSQWGRCLGSLNSPQGIRDKRPFMGGF